MLEEKSLVDVGIYPNETATFDAISLSMDCFCSGERFGSVSCFANSGLLAIVAFIPSSTLTFFSVSLKKSITPAL